MEMILEEDAIWVELSDSIIKVSKGGAGVCSGNSIKQVIGDGDGCENPTDRFEISVGRN